ncbi:MAG: ABC transporter permease, partial [Hyphomicrobium sp.]
MATDNFEAVAARAGGSVASFEPEHVSLGERTQRFLHNYPTAAPAFVLLMAVAFFYAIIGGKFLDPFNLSLVFQQVTIIGMIGVAQTLVILTAGIDLSVGAIMVLCSVVMGRTAIT